MAGLAMGEHHTLFRDAEGSIWACGENKEVSPAIDFGSERMTQRMMVRGMTPCMQPDVCALPLALWGEGATVSSVVPTTQAAGG